MKKFALGLILILLVSGCAGFDLSGIIPGLGGGKNINATVMSPDVIVIKNVNVIPSSPINSADQFSVSFELVNQDEIKYVTTNYELFDTGLCTKQSTGDSDKKTDWDIVPSGTEFVQWDFQAPSNEEIAYLPNKCPIRFNVNYTYNATTQIDVDVISQTRLTELQKAGTPPTFTSSLIIGRGPVKIQLSFGTVLPVRGGIGSNPGGALPIFITVEDAGTGLLGTVPANALKIYIPSLFTIADKDRFTCFDTSRKVGYKVCENTNDINIIRKKSSQMRIGTQAPPEDMERTYFITAELNYNYEIIGETSVSVKPTLDVGGTSAPTTTPTPMPQVTPGPAGATPA